MIPLIDLKAQMETLRPEVLRVTEEVLFGAQYIMGKYCTAFEKDFADYIGVRHALGVANGTDGLVIALKALGIGAGDEVLTTPYTFFATAEAIAEVGAVPVFVDVRDRDYQMDADLIETKITEKTKAILAVHIFGACAPMDEIRAIAKKHDLAVIEDACQAAGATYGAKKAGAMSDIAVFSFFPTKNLGGCGDGGIITTDDDTLAVRVKALRMHGSGKNGRMAVGETAPEEKGTDDNTVYNPEKYYNYLIGTNSRLDEIQAAILSVKLPHLDTYNERRRALAARYREALGDMLTFPTYDEGAIYHLMIAESDRREIITAKLAEKGIATGVYYPVPLHLQKAFQGLSYREGDLPVAEEKAHRTFALPLWPEMDEKTQDEVIRAVKECFRG